MTLRLFPDAAGCEPIELPDADICYAARFDLGRDAAGLLDELIAQTPWKQEEIELWGKKHLQPRLTAWYGDPDARYTYSGLSLEPLAWTATLADLRSRIERAAAAPFNSVLLNYYRDGRDRMGLHSDDEPELGVQPVIASLSLGEPRTFVLRHRRLKTLKPVRIVLDSGSLLVMRGPTQHNWKHGIDATSKPCGPRVNLTFRRILS